MAKEGPVTATILLVEADLSSRADWQAILQNHGYEVFTADDGETAMDECPRVRPDLVLLAAALPDISGFELCEQLKADPRNRMTPVVVMAPLSDRANVWEPREVGADDVWEHPSSRWEALTRVQTILHLNSYINEQAESVMLSLARSIEAKDPYTDGHCERLAFYATTLAMSLGLSERDLEALHVGGLIHDIGKVVVPEAILLKPGRLTREEVKIMEKHPVVGEHICAPLKALRRVLPIIRHHHERMDGSGYPDGLQGDCIPLTARILQVVDIYDALTTDRPYRRAVAPSCALDMLVKEVECGWLDGMLVDHFLSVIAQVESHVH
jgi:putative two-component system response regulator